MSAEPHDEYARHAAFGLTALCGALAVANVVELQVMSASHGERLPWQQVLWLTGPRWVLVAGLLLLVLGLARRFPIPPVRLRAVLAHAAGFTAFGSAHAVVGVIFKRFGAPIGDVLTSPMFRTRETAQYAFGRYTDAAQLIAMSASDDERAFILAMPAAGTNRVLVTHHFVIERNVPGIKPGDVVEGEAVIARSNGQVLRPIAIIKMKDWIRLHDQPGPNGVAAVPAANQPATPYNGYGAATAGSRSNATLVIPALLQTEQRAGVAEYLRAFSSGDQTRMRAFLERWTNANPQRTIEQRVESLKGYMDETGSSSIVSAEAVGANQVVVKVLGSTGKPATMTFTIADTSPYRVSVMMQVGSP